MGGRHRGPLLQADDGSSRVPLAANLGRNPRASVDTSNPAINRHFKTGHFASTAETGGCLPHCGFGSQVRLYLCAPAPRSALQYVSVV